MSYLTNPKNVLCTHTLKLKNTNALRVSAGAFDA